MVFRSSETTPTAHDDVATRTLVIDLALVQSQLRSAAQCAGQSGPTPHGTAQRDQLVAHERDIRRTLRRRRLTFRAATSDGVTVPVWLCGPSKTPGVG